MTDNLPVIPGDRAPTLHTSTAVAMPAARPPARPPQPQPVYCEVRVIDRPQHERDHAVAPPAAPDPVGGLPLSIMYAAYGAGALIAGAAMLFGPILLALGPVAAVLLVAASAATARVRRRETR